MIDYRYTELGEGVKDIFECINKDKDKLTTEDLEIIYFYARNDEEPDMFYTVLVAAVYEAKKGILTKKMTKRFLEYADRFDKGEFQPDMMPEDIPIVAKDIEFVRSKISL